MAKRNTGWMAWFCAGGLVLSGCGTPSVETGEYDRDAYVGESEAGQPSTLFEMDFGGGETEVTKNLPGDAAHKVGDAVKSTLRKSSPPDITGD